MNRIPKPKVGDKTSVRFRFYGGDNYCLEEGEVVKVEDANDKSFWRLKVKTESGTYTIHRSKK